MSTTKIAKNSKRHGSLQKKKKIFKTIKLSSQIMTQPELMRIEDRLYWAEIQEEFAEEERIMNQLIEQDQQRCEKKQSYYEEKYGCYHSSMTGFTDDEYDQN